MKIKKIAFLSFFILSLSVLAPMILIQNGTATFNVENSSLKTNSTSSADYNIKLNITWDAKDGSKAKAIAVDDQGNFFVTGQVNGIDNTNVYVTKYNNLGTLMWNITWDSSTNDTVREITVDDWGNVYITGWNVSGSIPFLLQYRVFFSITSFIHVYLWCKKRVYELYFAPRECKAEQGISRECNRIRF